MLGEAVTALGIYAGTKFLDVLFRKYWDDDDFRALVKED